MGEYQLFYKEGDKSKLVASFNTNNLKFSDILKYLNNGDGESAINKIKEMIEQNRLNNNKIINSGSASQTIVDLSKLKTAFAGNNGDDNYLYDQQQYDQSMSDGVTKDYNNLITKAPIKAQHNNGTIKQTKTLNDFVKLIDTSIQNKEQPYDSTTELYYAKNRGGKSNYINNKLNIDEIIDSRMINQVINKYNE